MKEENQHKRSSVLLSNKFKECRLATVELKKIINLKYTYIYMLLMIITIIIIIKDIVTFSGERKVFATREVDRIV